MDSQLVIYTSTSLSHIPVVPNANLQTIIQSIDTTLGQSTAAPDYTGYSLACVTQTDGTSHPTNTQNFAEGISKILCDLKTAYTTFTGTTYVTDQGVITAAITGLQDPGLTYTPFSITSADGVNTVWTKTFTGLTAITTSINPASANWSSISVSPSPTTIVGAMNNLIAYDVTLATSIAGKQASLGTFNNASNCLSGTSTDTPVATINHIISYLCALPTYTISGITWGCISTPTTLQSSVANIANTVNSIANNFLGGVGTGLTSTSNSCSGYIAAVDPTWLGLYKTIVTGAAYTTAGYLDTMITSNANTITITTSGNKVNLEVAHPVTNKVAVNSSDTTPDFLVNKLFGGTGAWGISIIPVVSPDNDNITFTAEVTNPELLISNFFNYTSTDPASLSAFCALGVQCGTSTTCAAPTGLTVAYSSSHFALTWTVSGSAISQTVQYRQRGSSSWISNINISSPNPQTNSAASATVSNLSNNVAYQFQVLSNCTTGNNGTAIYESIKYAVQTLTHTSVNGIISVNQSQLSTVDTIQYRLVDSNSTVIQNNSATGLAPQTSFTSVASGTYTVQYRYGTLINGVELYSDDASQIGSWSTTGSITV